MIYEFWLVGNGGNISDTLLFSTDLDSWSRPTKGQQIKIKHTLFEVLRTDPITLPPDSETVKIYIEKYNPVRPFKRDMNITRKMEGI